MLLCLLGLFLCLLPFADQVFQIVAQPIMDAMPEGSSLISKQVASPFLTPLKATFWVSLFAAMPLLLYHLWKLVDAWLPASKRRVALPFIAASAGLVLRRRRVRVLLRAADGVQVLRDDGARPASRS